MAPEIYEMKCEKEHPIYTKKIDLFSLGQSILCLMGYIQKASALSQSMINELKESCRNLFEGNRKEKMLADLIFNYLLIVDPEKRADWMTYFNHPIFEDYNVVTQVKDENIKRIEKRYIKRNSIENSKIEIPKNNRLFKYTKENNNNNNENKFNDNKNNENKVNENKVNENNNNKKNNLEKEPESIVVYGKSFKLNDNNNANGKDIKKENIKNYNKHKTHKVIKEKYIDKKLDNFSTINNNKDGKDGKYNLYNNKTKNNSTSNIIAKNENNKKEKNQFKIINIEKVDGLENKEDNNNIIYNQNTKNTNRGMIKDIKIKYIKNNFNIKKNRVLPFDISGFNIEKKKTYTNPKTNGIISISNVEKENKQKTNKSNEKNKNKIIKNERYYEYDKNNNDNNKEEKNQFIVFSNNKSHKYLTKFKNNSNSNEIIYQINNKNQEKTPATQNHFFSVRNKYKSLVHKKENFIRKNLTNMKLEPEKKENKINNNKMKDFSYSQNFSPKSFKNFEGAKFNPLYEERNKNNNTIKDKNDNNDKRINYFQNEKGNEEKGFVYEYPRNTIKLHKFEKNLLPYDRFSKSHTKFNNNYTFNKNNMTMYDTNYKIHIGNHFNSNIMTVTEANHKPNISTDLNGEVSNNYNKISYIFNSNNLKNKSITYFNIRVVNNQVEENLNKLNRNNAFYFSKYSRYNQNY